MISSLKSQTFIVNRTEVKYLISQQQYEVLVRLLRCSMKKDKNAKDNGDYFVRSMYFDSFHHEDYHMKEEGLYQRKKIRVRLYNIDSNFVKLEMKNKFGAITRKESIRIEKEDALLLEQGQYGCLQKYPNATSFYIEFISKLMIPTTIIDYEREAYVLDEYNIRVNFDKNIRATVSNLKFFDKNLMMNPVHVEPEYILEVKYNEYLPDFIIDFLSTCEIVKCSYSKYFNAVEYLKNG